MINLIEIPHDWESLWTRDTLNPSKKTDEFIDYKVENEQDRSDKDAVIHSVEGV